MEVDCGFGLHHCNIVDWAVHNGHENIAIMLLQLGLELGIEQELAIGAQHAFFWSINHQYNDALRALLEANADPAQKNSDGLSALAFAARHSCEDAALLLIERGAWEQESQKSLVEAWLLDRRMTKATAAILPPPKIAEPEASEAAEGKEKRTSDVKAE